MIAGPDAGITDDAFLGGALNILQPARGHRSGLDAVLLAAGVPAAGGETVLDMGCGVGVAGLCVLARLEDTRAILLDRDKDALALAGENAARNGFGGRVRTLCHDLEARGGVAQAGIAQGTLDHALANPPFFAEKTARHTPDEARRGAHVAGPSLSDSLARWAAFAAGALRRGGSFTMIHRADALGEVLSALEGRFGAVSVLPVYPRPQADAIRILVCAVKGSRAPVTLRPGLVLHPAKGEGFMPQAEAVLRAPLALSSALRETK